MMLVLKFGRWSHSALEKYTYDRIYRNGYKWTPFCRRQLRYVTGGMRIDTIRT